MDQSKRSFRVIMTVLVSLASLLLFVDLYEIVAGKVDLNRHLPFLLPGVIFLLVGITYKTERIFDRVDALRKKNPSARLARDDDSDIF